MRLHSPLALAGYLSFLLLGWDAVLVPSLVRTIEAEFHVSDPLMALYYLLGSVAFASSAFGAGPLINRLGQRWTLALAVGLAGVAHLGMAWAPVWTLFIAIGVAASAGRAGMEVGVGSLFLDLFTQARGRSLNFLHLFFAIGSLLGPFNIGLLISDAVPWRALFAWTALPYALLFASLLAVPMPPHQHHPPARRGSHLSLSLLLLGAAIAAYTGAELGVNSWLVRYLHAQPLALATAALSLFWGGLATGRLLSRWAAGWLPEAAFTATAALLASLSLAGAVLSPTLLIALPLFTLAGFFYGPVYPTIMAVAGTLFPGRSAAVTGLLTTAASIGVIIYPPLMGFVAGSIGLEAGLIGAAALGTITAGAVLGANRVR